MDHNLPTQTLETIPAQLTLLRGTSAQVSPSWMPETAPPAVTLREGGSPGTSRQPGEVVSRPGQRHASEPPARAFTWYRGGRILPASKGAGGRRNSCLTML